MNQQRIVYRTPGKVLLSGGYGVLEHGNVGLVLALNCFFYSTVYQKPADKLIIHVTFPQISNTWKYSYENHTLLEDEGKQSNKYVYSSIKTVLEFFKDKQVPKKQLNVYLLFDEGFLSAQDNEYYGTFRSYNNASKQGLGSSACVVVSMVNILCQLFEVNSKQIIERLSHISNLIAQTKIGSNFDISSAVFGSQLYTNTLPQYALQYSQSGGENKQLFKIVSQVQKLKFHNKYQILLVDLFQGSNTVKMVSGFLTRLKGHDVQTQNRFFQSSRSITEKLYQILQQENIDKKQLKSLNSKHRKLQQEYGKLTQTQIEPEGIKEKLDQFYQNEDILYVICPGSGGYDSVAILIEEGKQLNIPSLKFSIDYSGLSRCSQAEAQRVIEYINK